MLKTWMLERFKSVYDRTELQLGPLTLFAGVNNSGKSTVLQSILLAAQTLQMPLQERPITLNGHIVRLGTFNDIVSSGHEGKTIKLGFSLSQLQQVGGRPRFGQRRFTPSFVRQGALENVESLGCEFSFSSRGEGQPPEILQIQPNLEASELRLQFKSEDASSPRTETVSIRRRHEDVREFAALLKLTAVTVQDLRALEYEVVKTPSSSATGLYPPGRTVGAFLYHFVPRYLLTVYDEVEHHANQITRAFTATPEPWRDDLGPSDFEGLPQEFKELVLEVCELVKDRAIASASPITQDRIKDAFEELKARFSPEAYRRLLARFNSADRTVVYQLMADRQNDLNNIARQNRAPEYRTRFRGVTEPLDSGAEAVVEFFQDYLKYLAPLRDEPKPVYPLSTSTDPTDVGFRGEHTAAVLELNRNRTVEYISSASLQEGGHRKSEYETLYAAVLDWLEYMGIVTDVKTSDLGKLGHELKVATGENMCLRDLTHVGVGVSQVLPIVVLALLADRGSTLIFEQPELHLHPRVQSRLADFFLSMMLLGKQCIVETHSEHLINKLRQHVASSDQPEMANNIVMYFVEATSGKSTYRRVEITPSGTIKDWPKGFFDEGEELAAEILKAGIAKRNRSTSRK
ncbi:MAG TPA: DUF3696 domain-containing protein [Candidatus Acidoferrum sp.]|nr:DUF3696 domain-containing protein [Candidatus Acidoferrum sp.]